MEIIDGRIIDVQPGAITIRARYDDAHRLTLRQYDEVQIALADGRRITPEQRRKAFALLGEIAAHTGYTKDEAHLTLKHEFVTRHLDQLQRELFSLSDCDVTTAREYIAYLIDFCLEFDVATRQPLADLCDDVQRYVYACLMRKKCCVCGKKTELHHVDRIGMGGDRRQAVHIGRRALPLCRLHHMEVDQIGDDALCAKYHVAPVIIDDRIAKKYRLKTKGA